MKKAMFLCSRSFLSFFRNRSEDLSPACIFIYRIEHEGYPTPRISKQKLKFSITGLWILSIVRNFKWVENGMFRKLDLFLPSGEGKSNLLCWVSSKHLTSISGLRLVLCKRPNNVGVVGTFHGNLPQVTTVIDLKWISGGSFDGRVPILSLSGLLA
jgi:hypothetical protein